MGLIRTDKDGNVVTREGDEEETTSRPGAGQFLAQGALIEGPSNLAGVADALRDAFSNKAVDRPDGGFDIESVPRTGPSFSQRARSAGSGFVERNIGPVTEPESFGERALQAGAAGVVETLPTLPLLAVPGIGQATAAARAGKGLSAAGRALGGAVPKAAQRAAFEATAASFGEIARSEAQNAGYGPTGQFILSLAAATVPIAAARGVAVRIAPQVSRGVRQRQAKRLAAEVLGEEIEDRKEAIVLLAQEADKPLFGNASTSQVLNQRFPGVEGIARRVSRSGTAASDLRREVARSRFENAQAAREFAETSVATGGRPGAAVTRFGEALDSIQTKVQRAYIKTGHLEIPMRKIKAASAATRLDALDITDDLLPSKMMDLLDNAGETMDVQRLNKIRGRLLSMSRKLSKEGAEPQQVRYVDGLVASIDETLDEVAEIGGGEAILALRRANQIRRIEAERFGLTRQIKVAGRRKTIPNTLNRMLGGESEDLDKAFRKFLNSDPRTGEALQQAKLTLGDNPEAWKGVGELMNRQVFGPDFDLIFDINNPAPFRGKEVAGLRRGQLQAFKNLRRFEKEYDVVFGPGAAANARQFLRRTQKLGSGVIGRADEFLLTGSSVGDAGERMKNASVLSSMMRQDRVGAGVAAWKLLTGRLPSSLTQADELLAKALADPATAKVFLEGLDANALLRWQRQADAALGNPLRALGGTQGQDAAGK